MEYFFDSREEASVAAATRIVECLSRRLDGNGEASLVVSGGTTPARCLAELAATPLDWQRIHVLLSDERWVPSGDEASNERLVRETLLQDRAADAQFLPVYAPGATPAEGAATLDEAIRGLPFPFAAVLLGMGEDGHFASLFADADNLAAGLDVDNPDLCLPVSTAASPHPRITLTLSALSRSDTAVLLFFGEAKRRTYEAAKASASAFPLSHLLRQKRAPVRVFWAP